MFTTTTFTYVDSIVKVFGNIVYLQDCQIAFCSQSFFEEKSTYYVII